VPRRKKKVSSSNDAAACQKTAPHGRNRAPHAHQNTPNTRTPTHTERQVGGRRRGGRRVLRQEKVQELSVGACGMFGASQATLPVRPAAFAHALSLTRPPSSFPHPQQTNPTECCIFHKQRAFGEWSDSEDSGCDECGPPPPAPPPDGGGGGGGAGPSNGSGGGQPVQSM
jgi:hypothetical protein